MVFDAVGHKPRRTDLSEPMVSLAISNGRLHCRDSADTTHWSIATSELVLIAEYTTCQRRNCDDYFLVFVTRESGEFFYLEVSGCASGVPEVFAYLEDRFACSMDLTLQSSTDWASRVIWPAALAGSAFYEFEKLAPAGLRDRMRSMLKGREITKRVAEPVLRYLNECAPPAATLQNRTA